MGFLKKLAILTVVLGALFAFKPALASNLDTLAKGGAGGWLNVTRPLTIDDMKGRLVLLDFWTYGCVNCMHIVPDLKKLESKFGDKLLVVGVHSAKFKGEQGNSRILSAAKRFGLEHPVINDSDFAIWNSFKVQAWPTLILLGADGQEISRYEGEGHLKEMDATISKHINNVSSSSTSIATLIPKDQTKTTLSFPARIKEVGGAFYIADSGNNRIVVVDKTGQITHQYEGFQNPRGFTVVNQTLYVADTDAHRLVSVDMTTGQQTILGGDGTRGRLWASPWDIDVINDNELVIAMAGTHRLNSYSLADKDADGFAGNGREAVVDGDAEDAELAQPSAVFKTEDGSVYFVDAESSALRVVKDGQVKTLIGTGLFDFGLKDGTYPTAQMQHPQGLFVKGNKIYLADTYNNAIRVYDIATKELSTLKTNGETMNEPGSIWVGDEYGLITDTNNNRILKLDLKTANLSAFPIIEK